MNDRRSAPRFRDVMEDSGVVTKQLDVIDGSRLRAFRSLQQFSGRVDVPETVRDHTLAYCLRRAGPIKRYYDGRLDKTVDGNRTVTLAPAFRESSWCSDAPAEVLHMYIDDSTFREVAERDLDVDPKRVTLNDSMGVIDPFVERFARLVMHEMQSDLPTSELMLDSMDVVLASHLLRAYSNMGDRVRSGDGKRLRDKGKIAKARAYLAETLDQNVGLHAVAEHIDMSVFAFARAFRAEVGLPPHQYLTRLRMDRVCDLLKHTDDSIADIAYAAGFSSQAHMTDAFRKHLGLTPLQYRKQTRS